MTKYLKATSAAGHIFTRTTMGRNYTHMVVAVYDVAQERVRAEKSVRGYWKLNLKYYQELAAGARKSQPLPASGFHASHGMDDPVKYAAYVATVDADNARHLEGAKEWLAKGEQGHVDEELADFDANRATSRHLNASRTLRYTDAGWCGRLDLAEKLANTVAKRAMPCILETVEITKAEYNAIKKSQKAKK